MSTRFLATRLDETGGRTDRQSAMRNVAY